MLVYTNQVNSAFCARWLANSEVISQVLYTLFQNGLHLDILLFLLKLDLDASFKAKYSFEFAAQERGIKG